MEENNFNKTNSNLDKSAWIILILLSLFQIVFGIIPGWQKIQDDFPNYYVSARLLTEHQDLSVLYHNESFNEKVKSFGMQPVGQFALYAPPNALLLVPLSGLEPLTAKRCWLLFNVLLILVAAFLIRKITGWSRIFSFIIILLSGFALANDLFLGQVYLLMTVLMLWGYLLFITKKKSIAGLLFGFVIAIKYVAIVFVPSLFLMKKWKMLASILSGILILYLICLPFFGIELISYFFKHVFISHLNGMLYEGRPYAVQYQSWDSLLNNLFVADSTFNPNPFIPSMFAFQLCKIALLAMAITILAWLFIRSFRQVSFLNVTVSISFISILILEPGSATYHNLFLLLPFILILQLMKQSNSPMMTGYIILFSLIGFLPTLLNKFNLFNGSSHDHSDIRFLLSYHRLWLEMIFYFFSVYFLYRFVKNNSIQKTERRTEIAV